MELQELKGTKEYMPEEQLVREKITDILKNNFKKFGFLPIQTTILESYEIASSKYAGGEEILKETYKLKDQGGRDLCLRYELTFKLGKLIGINPNIRLPFKRYEIGSVFRDGPVKTGRLREFTQCDVDCVGIKDVSIDAELMSLSSFVFKDLNIDTTIKVNERKVLFGIFEYCKIAENDFLSSALTLDKLEKVGKEAVEKELIDKGLSVKSVSLLLNILDDVEKLKSNNDKIQFLRTKLTSENAKTGLDRIQEFFTCAQSLSVSNIDFVPSLSRGLGYYTGMMFEVYAKNSSVTSSIAAGGRWDKMISQFLATDKEYPATGISFGLDSIYSVIKEKKDLKLFKQYPKVLLVPINTLNDCFSLATRIRKEEISCEVAIGKKLLKALDYADKSKIPFVIVVGEEELKTQIFKLKDMNTGVEESFNIEGIIKKLK